MQPLQSFHAGAASEARSFTLLKLTLVIASLLAICLWFGDRRGFEGDGLAIVFGIDNLEVVGRGNVYRYYWQPLAYEVTARLAHLLSSPLQINLLGSAFGAVGLGLLAALLRLLLRGVPFPLLTSLILLACIPELFATALYFNASALALPFVAGSFLLLRLSRWEAAPIALPLAAGALMALGCLFRFDFLACLPFAAVVLVLWGAANWKRDAVCYVAGVVLVAIVFLALFPHFASEASAYISTYGAGEYADSTERTVRVFVFALGPAFIVLVLFARLLWKSKKLGDKGMFKLFRPGDFWLALALLPLLVPLTFLYSGKYLIPFFVCFLIVVAMLISRGYWIAPNKPLLWRRIGRSTVAISALTLVGFTVLSVPDPASFKRHPLNAIFSEPMRAGTHDAFRTAGGYLRFAQWMRDFEHRHVKVQVAYQVAELIDRCDSNVTVFMSSNPKYGENVWSWGWIPLYLGGHGWNMTEYEPAKRALLLDNGTRRKVVIARHGLPVPDADNTAVLDFDKVTPREGEDYWVAAKRWVDQMSNDRFCPSEGAPGLRSSTTAPD
jgi:hypothetical protein